MELIGNEEKSDFREETAGVKIPGMVSGTSNRCLASTIPLDKPLPTQKYCWFSLQLSDFGVLGLLGKFSSA